MDKINNIIFFRGFRANRARKKLINSLQSEAAEEFLELLLKLMSLIFFLNKDFMRNIEKFNGRYLFRSKDDEIAVAAVFKKNRMKVYEKKIANPTVSVIFRDQKALMSFLLSPKPDILGSILRQDVTFRGNLNYLSKFAYMSKRLQLMMTGSL